MYTDNGPFIQRQDGACIPRDPLNADYMVFREWLEEGNRAEQPPGPDLAERMLILLAGVDAHLHAPAKLKGYDTIRSAALRAGYQGPFHDEGIAFATWMDACYARCYQLLAKFQAGEIPEPTLEELLALLPKLELP
jgi:hypothetical protein